MRSEYPDFPFVSVIVPAYNAEQRIAMLLEALLAQSYSIECYEIIIVDNNSKDYTAKLAGRYPVKLIKEERIQSSYAARNKGCSIAKGDVFAFIDSDCMPCRDWISQGIFSMLDQKSHLVAGKVEFIADVNSVAHVYDSIMNIQVEEAVKRRGVAMTANLFVKSEVFRHLGGFEDQTKSGGDIHFTHMAYIQGYRLIYSAEALVTHPARNFKELVAKAYRTAIGKRFLDSRKDTQGALSISGRRLSEHVSPMIMIDRVLRKYPFKSTYFAFKVYVLHILLLMVSVKSRLFNSQSGRNKKR